MSGLRIISLGLALSALATAPAWTQEAPHLLADINRSPYVPYSFEVHEEPEDFFNLGGRLFFSTTDPSSLDQGILWSTDGTAEGTRQVSTTLCPSACARISALGFLNGVALLQADSSTDGFASISHLARTDGTPGGTYLLTGDVYSASGLPVELFPLPDRGAALFSLCAPNQACRLWSSDGTRAGTGPFVGTDALPLVAPHAFSLWHGRLYFVALHGEGGDEGLWSTDGTPTGTRFLQAVGELDDRSARTVATPSHLFFTAGEKGEDLWATDGTPAGTVRLADFDPQPCAVCDLPDVASMTASGDRVYFETHRAGHAIEIWKSDGTPQGTRPRIELPARVLDAQSFHRVGGHWLFFAETADQPPVFWTVDDGFSRASRLTGCDGESCPAFYHALSPPGASPEIFVGMDNLNGFDPWVTDGTAAGTRRLAHPCPGYCPIGPSTVDSPPAASPGGTLLFHAYSPQSDHGTGEDELWRTDGTPEGTWRIAQRADGSGFLNGHVYFGSSGGPGHLGSELWGTDGTAGGAHRVTFLRSFEPGSAPVFQAFRDGALILTANADGQAALWRSSGTPAGTFPVFDFSGDARKVRASFIGPPGPLQFLFLDVQPTDPHQRESSELWRTDGTPRGTRAILKLSSSESVFTAIAWRGGLVFNRVSPESCALWSSDSTAAGTHQLFPAASPLHCPQPLTALGSDFLYAVPNVGRRQVTRLFRSDGTVAGTREIARLGGSVGSQPLLVGGTVFFQVFSDTSTEIWQTDGTAAGTRRATTLAEPSDLQAFDGSLYLTAALGADHDAGRALFRLPSSGGPPIQLAKLFRYSESQLVAPMQLSPVGDKLAFTVQDLDRGLEVWATDGTPGGTRRLRSFQPTPDVNRQPAILAGAGDRVFFAASDGVAGWELWESDGTPEGTRRVKDLAPGGFSSLSVEPSFAVANGSLFFSADDSKTGLEPWALPLEPW